MKRVRCPNCGVYHDIDEPKSNTFENRVRRPFRTDAMAPTFPQPEINQQAPTGLPGWDSHVKIPLRQAVIFGLFDAPIGVGVGLVGGVGLAMLFNAASRDNLTPWGYVIIIGTGGAIGGLIALCQEAKRRWPERLEIYDALLWVEEVTGMDIDGDGEVGQPVQPERLQVEITENGVPRELDELEIGRQRLTVLARLIFLDGKSFAERTAEEAGINRDEWVRLRDRFIGRSWATWKNASAPKLGIVLRRKGAGLLQGLLPPTLSGGDSQNNVGGTHAPRSTQDLTGRYDHIQGAK